jgi:hypothetical protein
MTGYFLNDAFSLHPYAPSNVVLVCYITDWKLPLPLRIFFRYLSHDCFIVVMGKDSE